MLRDISTGEDVKHFVDEFYGRALKDALLGPVFQERIKAEDWPEHLNRIYGFWNSILLGTGEYRGSAFDKHIGLPIDGSHFKRWMDLFRETLDELFEGPVKDDTLKRAGIMAQLFESKLDRLRNDPLAIH